MSDNLVRKIVVVNPTTDERETRYLAASAENIDNLDSFIGLGVDGNVGPITKLTGQDAFSALFTDTETQSWVLPYGFKGTAYKIGNSLVGAYIERINFSLRLSSTSVYKRFYAKGLADEKLTLSCNGASGDYTTVPFKAYIANVEQAGTFNLTEEHNSDGQLAFSGSFSSLPSTSFSADFINSEGFWLVSKYGKTLLETEDKEKIDSLEELDGTKIPLDRTTSLDYTIKDKFNSIDNILKSETLTISSSTTDATPINVSTIYWNFDSNQNLVYRVKSLYGRPICVELLSATLKVGSYSESCNAKYAYRSSTIFIVELLDLLKTGWKDNVIDYKFIETPRVYLLVGDTASSTGTLKDWVPSKEWSENTLRFNGNTSGDFAWCTIAGSFDRNTPLITFYF